MEKLKCIKVSGLDFSPKKMGDLIYYQGPLLSHFQDATREDEHFFYRWVDNDEQVNRWLIFKSTREDLLGFFAGNCSELDLIAKNNTATFLDLDDDLGRVGIYVSAFEDIPDDYLPSQNTFFEASRYEPYALELKSRLEISLNGENILNQLSSGIQKMQKQQKETKKLLSDVKSLLSALEYDAAQYQRFSLAKPNNLYQKHLLNLLSTQKSYYNK